MESLNYTQEEFNGRICPRCGNDDYDDDFFVIRCSECDKIYYANEAKQTLIKFPKTDGEKNQ
jgi:predicted nucleic-acid-binding Zn-ribbon protein